MLNRIERGEVRIIHKWKLVSDTGKHRYYECSACSARKVLISFSPEGYQPLDKQWLKGKEAKFFCRK